MSSSHASLTGLLAVALGASLSFGPAAAETVVHVDRIDTSCQATTDDWLEALRPADDADLCGADLTRTVDVDEVLVELELGLDVAGEVTPSRERLYSFSLVGRSEGPAGDTGCELTLELGGVGTGALIAGGDCGTSGTATESLLTGRAAGNATAAIDGGRLTITFDMTRWDAALAELLRAQDGFTLTADVNGSRDHVRGVATFSTTTHSPDTTGPLTVARVGVTPATQAGDPCADVRSMSFALAPILCDGAVTGVVGDDGILTTVELTASARGAQQIPDRLTWTFGAAADGCQGLVEVTVQPDGGHRVAAGSMSCDHEPQLEPGARTVHEYLGWAQVMSGTALHEVPGAVVEHTGDAVRVTVPAATGVPSVDDLFMQGRTFSELQVEVGSLSLIELLRLPGFTLGG